MAGVLAFILCHSIVFKKLKLKNVTIGRDLLNLMWSVSKLSIRSKYEICYQFVKRNVSRPKLASKQPVMN